MTEAEKAQDLFKPGDNIRYVGDTPVRFNASIPTTLDVVPHRGDVEGSEHQPLYQEGGSNRKGFIVRDFNMNKKLAGVNAVWTKSTEHTGFQFHFNPPTLSETFSPLGGYDYAAFIRQIATAPLILLAMETGASVSFDLLLARNEDQRILRRSDWENYYPPGGVPTAEDRQMILEMGTQYDIEYFFRTVNLDPLPDLWRSSYPSSDWGLLMGMPVIISVGDSAGSRKFRAQIHGLSVKHLMWAPGMIPVYTQMSFDINRLPDVFAEELYATGGSSAAPGAIPGVTPGVPLAPEQTVPPASTSKPPNNDINFSNSKGTSKYGHEVHAALCAQFPWLDRAGTFGDYWVGANSNHGNGRALDIMVAVDPKNGTNRAWEVARYLQAVAGQLLVTQVIFQQKIWTTQRAKEGWRPMEDRGSITQNHFDHIHVSFGDGSGTSDQSNKLTLWTSKQYWKR